MANKATHKKSSKRPATKTGASTPSKPRSNAWAQRDKKKSAAPVPTAEPPRKSKPRLRLGTDGTLFEVA